jgi:hypothetical protein
MESVSVLAQNLMIEEVETSDPEADGPYISKEVA